MSYNRFVELESRVFFPLMFFLNLRAFGRCTGITFVDSTMIPICHNLRRYANKVFKGIATDGKGTMGWCHGFKLHLACNDRGEIIAFVLTGANVSDKDPAVFDVLAKRLYGKLFADKGYISQKLFDSLFEEGIQLVTVLPFVDSFHQFIWCKYLHLREAKPLFAQVLYGCSYMIHIIVYTKEAVM